MKSRQQKSRQQKSRQQKSRQQKSRQQKSRQQKRTKTVKNNRKRFIGGSNMVPYIATAIAGVGYGLFQKNKLEHLKLDLSTKIDDTQQQHDTEETEKQLLNVKHQEHILRLSNELDEAKKRAQSIQNTSVPERLDIILQSKKQKSKQQKTMFDFSHYSTFANLPGQCSEDKVANFAIRALKNDKKLQDFLTVNNRLSPPMLLCVGTHGRVKTEQQNNKLIVDTFTVPHNISLTIIYLTKFGLINYASEAKMNSILDMLDNILKTKTDLTSFTLMQITKWIFTQSNQESIKDDDTQELNSSVSMQKLVNQYKTFNTSPVVVTFLPGEEVIEKLLDKDDEHTVDFIMNIISLTPTSKTNLTPNPKMSTTLSYVIKQVASNIQGSADIVLLDMSCSVTSSRNGDNDDLPHLIDFFDQQCQMQGLLGGSTSSPGSSTLTDLI